MGKKAKRVWGRGFGIKENSSNRLVGEYYRDAATRLFFMHILPPHRGNGPGIVGAFKTHEQAYIFLRMRGWRCAFVEDMIRGEAQKERPACPNPTSPTSSSASALPQSSGS